MSDLSHCFVNVGKTKRTTRSHGEPSHIQRARRQFASQAIEHIPGPPVEVRTACTCAEKPYAHLYHGEQKARA
jgi:hypothetical protein